MTRIEVAMGAADRRANRRRIMNSRRMTEQTGPSTSTLGRLGDALGALGSALLHWPERRRTYSDLQNLTDRELADIGLARGDIARVFEPDFRLPATPAANSNEVQPRRAA